MIPAARSDDIARSLSRKYGYHFVSLVAIVLFMVWGYTAILAVFYATLVSIGLSFIRRDTALTAAPTCHRSRQPARRRESSWE